MDCKEFDYESYDIDEVREEVEHLRMENHRLRDLYKDADAAADMAFDLLEQNEEIVQGVLADLSTLTDVPVGLLEAAIDNLISDLRKVVSDD